VRIAFHEGAFLGTRVNMALQVCLLSLRAFVPEAFRCPWRGPELAALSFFAEDATIDEVLYAMLQGFGEGRDH
jgi:hypothetical protein